MSDSDNILHSLDETLKQEELMFGLDHVNDDTEQITEVPRNSSYVGEPSQPYNEQSTLVGKRMKTVKETSYGLEDILMEMPSRTLGRRRGRFIEDVVASGRQDYNTGTFSRSTYSRRFGSNRRHRKITEVGGGDEELADEIFKEIIEDNKEVDNEEIRAIAVNMEIKRKIRRQAFTNRETKKKNKIGCWWMFRHNMSLKFRHFKEDTRKMFASAKLWDYHLKQVEGNFGSGVHSYFTFLRGLFLLSIPSFILSFSFISIPQLLDPPARSNPDVKFTGEELITGANWFTETIMYYGYYTNGTIQTIPGSMYKMPLAYLLATAGYFLLCLLWLVKSTATSFRRNYIEAKEDESDFISKVFCAWDFGITSEDASKLQHTMISTELKEILAEKRRHKESRSSSKKCKVFLYRLVTWMLYLAITGGCMALVYFVNKELLNKIKDSLEGIVVLQQISLALIISAINLVMPIFINLMTHWEDYKYPRHEMYIAVFRNFLLKLGMLAVICAFWTDGDLKSTQTNQTGSCWETDLGQEIYRLVIIDFLFTIIFATFCAEFIRKLLTKCIPKLKLAEFSIVNNVMDLIYGQTLCWIGIYFSPLLSLIIILKYFIMFYIKKVSVMQNCRMSTQRWRAAQSQTLFNAFLLLSFLLCAAFLCVVVFLETPSYDCGPYRGLNRSYDAIIIEFQRLASDESSYWFAFIMNVISSVWFLYSIVVILTTAVVLVRSRSIGYRKFAKALREQIALEGQDKALLLQWLRDVSTNHGQSSGGQHVVPLLKRHRDSIHSTSTSAPPSRHNSMSHEFQRGSDILTYVDPQHLDASHLKISDGSPGKVRKREHKDPLLHKALVNQAKRPATLYMEHNANDVFGSARQSPEVQNRSSSFSNSQRNNIPSTSSSNHDNRAALAMSLANQHPTEPSAPVYYDEGTF